MRVYRLSIIQTALFQVLFVIRFYRETQVFTRNLA